MEELARRFALENVGHSAGVFDQEKLAWMNRHYMKAAAPARLAAETSGTSCAPDSCSSARIRDGIRRIALAADGGVCGPARRDSRPRAVHFYLDAAEALARPEVAAVVEEPGARQVIAALASEIIEPLLDRESFRAVANRVKEKTGMKGKALFHPIRAALTGEGCGPELDLAVPAIDRGSLLPASARIVPIMSCQERAEAFARAI